MKKTIRKIMSSTGEAVRLEAQGLADESKQILAAFADSPARTCLQERVDDLIDRQIRSQNEALKETSHFFESFALQPTLLF